MSRRGIVVAMGAALALAWCAAGSAADLSGITGFDEFAENHDNIAKALAKTPSLAHDAEYLAHHPSLKRYLHDNPLARAEFDAEEDQPPPPAPGKGDDDKGEGPHGKHYAHPDGNHKFMYTNGTSDD